MRHLTIAALVLAGASAAAQAPPAPQMNPTPLFGDYNRMGAIPTARRLTAAEVRLARARLAGVFEALKPAPIFASPADRVSTLHSDASISDAGILEQYFIVYWTVPRDVRVTKSGEMHPKLGGAHDMLYVEINMPRDIGLDGVDSWTIVRTGTEGTPSARTYYPMPRIFGRVGGGEVYSDAVVITKDGRSPFLPAPAGVLLDAEIARHEKAIAESDALAARGLAELEASMTAEAIAARREKRARAWGRPNGNPERLQAELDAAARSDEDSARRERARFSAPATRDPKSTYWQHRLALESLETTRASLDDAGRAAPACITRDARFNGGADVRIALASGAPGSCVPMVYRRPDLVDRAHPADAHVVVAWFRGETCGRSWNASLPPTGRCGRSLPLLKAMDWGLARKALGWD